MIAATALEHGLTVVTRNVRHFEPTGVEVLNPYGDQEPCSERECSTMTVQELMQMLAQFPSDLRVVVNGYEDGYDDLSPERIVPNQDSSEHRPTPMGRQTRDPDGLTDNEDLVEALVMRRVSN